MTLYKAITVDGRDFHTGRVYYREAFERGETIKHPRPIDGHSDAKHYLSVSDSPLELPGARWPLELWEVEFVGPSWKPGGYDHKHAGVEMRGVRKLDPYLVYGPDGRHVRAILSRYERRTTAESDALWKAWTPSYSDLYWATREKAWALGFGDGPAWAFLSLLGDGWSTASGAALAVLLRHTIGKRGGLTKRQYERLTAPWRKIIGPAHPDDALPAKGVES